VASRSFLSMCKSVLGNLVSMRCVIWGNPTSSRSFRRYQDRGKGSSRSCAGGLLRCGSVTGITGADGRKRSRTQLGKDIPEPVQNKHREDAVGVGWTRKLSGVCWVSCPTVREI